MTTELLAANGYWPFTAHIDGVDRAAIHGAKHDYYFRQPEDFASGQRTYMANAQASIAVLLFDFKEPSAGAMEFSNALVALLAPRDRMLKKFNRPLVRLTTKTTEFIYREHRPWVMPLEIDFGPSTRRLFPHGLKVAGATQFAIAELTCAATDVIVDDGTWLNDRSPSNTPHESLPEWDQEGISTKLQALVDKLAATGIVTECALHLENSAVDFWSPEACLARKALRDAAVPAAPEPEPAPVYQDERLQRALFWRKGARGRADNGQQS
jgi:hypothetical protein